MIQQSPLRKFVEPLRGDSVGVCVQRLRPKADSGVLTRRCDERMRVRAINLDRGINDLMHRSWIPFLWHRLSLLSFPAVAST